MKTADLQRIMVSANMFDKIVLELPKYGWWTNAAPDREIAKAFIDHFAKTGRIIIIDIDETSSTVTFAKTPMCSEYDMIELTLRIFPVVLKAEVRKIPEHKLVLKQGVSGVWELYLAGGNKTMRKYFQIACKSSAKVTGVSIPRIEDRNARTTISFLEGTDEGVILLFSEVAAETMDTPLSM